MSKTLLQNVSLVSQGSRHQIVVATLLLAVLPFLAVCFIFLTKLYAAGTYPLATQIAVITLAFAFAASGYAILRAYSQNIIKLRQYLRMIAEGELPDKITLLNFEDDLSAIENYLNTVLVELRRKVSQLEEQLLLSRTMKDAIEAQQNELLDAERHRVMIQSVGAACHHLGQPATVLRVHLHFLKGQTSSRKELDEIAECETAVDSIDDILAKLRNVSEYRTVPYRTFAAGEKPGVDHEILDIESSRALPSATGKQAG